MRKVWLKRQRRIKASLKGTYVHRLLGESLFRNYLWIQNRRAIIGGLVLGVFIAFTPTIPFQMLLAALGALRWRLNLAIALAACWITNPFTLVPIYLFSWKLGRFVLEEIFLIEGLFDFYLLESGRFMGAIKQSAYLWTGSLILASFGALVAYGAAHLIWIMIKRFIKTGPPADGRKS